MTDRDATDPLRVRLDMTAPRPTFVDDDAGDYLVEYVGPPGSTFRHPDEPHEFRTTCLRCRQPGQLHVALITPNERVTIGEHRD